MARRLALTALVLLAGLALWLWRGKAPSAPPLAPPEAEPAEVQRVESARIESAPVEKREQLATPDPAKSALLVVLCRAKETGTPIANETLFLCEESFRPARVPSGLGTHGNLGESLATGPEGRVEFVVPANTPSHLWVSDWRNGPRPAQDGSIAALSVGEQRELAIEFDPPPENFCGRVIARDDRTPIAGASVINRGKLEFSTDADGRFALPASGDFYTISADGFAELQVVAQAGHESAEKALLVELERSGTLIGVLTNASALRASDTLRFQVSADLSRMLLPDPVESGGHHGLRGLRYWHAEFDARGRAVLTGLPPRSPLNVAVMEGGTKVLVLEDIRLAAGEKREVRLDPSGTCELSGCARDDADQPVAGLQLWLLQEGKSLFPYFLREDESHCAAITKTGGDGRFRIRGVAPGSWHLGPAWEWRAPGEALPADTVAPIPMRIEIPEGTPTLEIVLHVHRGIKIRGRVLDDEDRPVRAGVTAMAPGTVLDGQADANGNFELGPLAPGSYRVHADLPGTYLDSETVEAEAGAQDVMLRVHRGAMLAGQAVDGATGAGVVAELALSRPGDPRMSITVIHSQGDGSFEFGGLLPGSYSLVARMDDGRCGMSRAIEVGAGLRVDGLRIALAPGGSLRVHYDGQREIGNLQIQRDGALLAFDGVWRGKPARFRVPSGPVRLVFTVGAKEQVRELTLKAGEEQELVFTDED